MAKKKNMYEYQLKEDENIEDSIFHKLAIKEEINTELNNNSSVTEIAKSLENNSKDMKMKVQGKLLLDERKKKKEYVTIGEERKNFFDNKKVRELKTLNIYLTDSMRSRVKKSMNQYQLLTENKARYIDIFEAGLVEFEKYIKRIEKDNK